MYQPPEKNHWLIILVLTLLATAPAWSQDRKNDIIIKRDSSRVECRILLVDDQTIQYKKIRDPDGPIFHTHKSEIAKIIYGNGETEIFTFLAAPVPVNTTEPVILYPIPPWQIPEFMSNLPYHTTHDLNRSLEFYRSKSRSTKTAAIAIGSIGTAAAIVGVILLANSKEYSSYGYSYTDPEKQEIGTLLTIGGLGVGISIGLIGGLKSKQYRRKALLVEKELAKRKPRSSELKIHPSLNPFGKSMGISIALQF